MDILFKHIPAAIFNSSLYHYGLYEDDIRAYINANTYEFEYGQKRNNCGVVAAGFSSFMASRNLEIKRVEGFFHVDNGVYGILDFYPDELKVMNTLGFNHTNVNDRQAYVKAYGLTERQKQIPHYWNIDSSNRIIDLCAYSQFVASKLANDISTNRYSNTEYTLSNNSLTA